MTRENLPPCGNPKCSCSTGIHDGLTFGSGRLNKNGYCEHPCSICAQHHDDTREERLAELRQMGVTDEQLASYDYFWATSEAWPFKAKEETQ